MIRSLLAGIGIAAFLFSGCADEPSRPVGGGSIQPGENIAGLYVANADNSITRIDLDTGVMRQIELGNEPTRIARFGDRVYVSLRNERKVVVLEEDGADLNEVARIDTGAEPFGVAATSARLYVAASVGGTVDEYDTKTFAQLRSWRIAGEPRSLAMHPSSRALFVGSTYGGKMTRIDLESGVASNVELPRIESFNFRDGTPVSLIPRITGDIAVAPDGKAVYAPMLFVNNNISDDCGERGMGDASAPGVSAPPEEPNNPGCGGGGYDDQKFNPVVTKVPVEETNGEVVATPEAISIVAGTSVLDSNGVTVGFEQLSSYPSAVAVSADSSLVFATLEGSAAMVAFPSDLPGSGMGNAEVPVPSRDAAFPGGPNGSFGFRSVVPVKTGAAPRGIAVVGDKVYVHAFFDREIAEVELQEIQNILDYTSTGIFEKAADALNPDGTVRTIVARNARTVTTLKISADEDAGRRLFYAANNPMMSTVGAGVSCATCHFDNRTDGITWNFARGPRQTPNLSVKLEHTLPVGWAGNVPTVSDEGFNTSQELMGGTGLTHGHTAQIEKFLLGLRDIDSPLKGKADQSVVRGAAIFANKGCNTCHSGASYTDGKVYPMLGLEIVNTPALRGIAASAPFFHDGTAETLEDVIDRAAKGEMGQAFTITVDERADLVAYLKSL
jgi:cytochrome c peroxidase